jgi:hypothetical protein
MDRSDLTVASVGFLDGWGRALDQLDDLATELRGKA